MQNVQYNSLGTTDKIISALTVGSLVGMEVTGLIVGETDGDLVVGLGDGINVGILVGDLVGIRVVG